MMRVLAAVLAGVAHALAIAWPFAVGPAQGQPLPGLQVLSLVALVALLNGVRSTRQAALTGAAFGTAMLAATFWWLFISMHVYGGLPAALAVLAVLALAAFLGSYCAAACAAFVHLTAGRPRGVQAVCLFAALWTLAELARTVWFTGFPWGVGGYAHVEGPLSAWPRWMGVLGTGTVAAAMAAGLALLRRHNAVRVGGFLLVLAGATAFTQWGPRYAPVPEGSAGTMAVTLLQGNIPQDEKFVPGKGIEISLDWYGDHIAAARTPLVVGPETAVPLLPAQLPPGYWAWLRRPFADAARGAPRAALMGIPLGSFEAGYTNSVIGLRPGQAADYTYSKHHLVPFGEFIPPGFRWFVALMNIPLGDFNRGAVGQPSFEWQGQRLAPNICYEDLFGEELGARFRDPAQAPTAFVNVSNIGWFGDSVAIDQHLLISRMRSLEFARPMLRATNTGATVVIDHTGRVTHALPRLTRGVLVGEFEGRTGLTPYAAWVSRFGLWPFWALCGAIVAWAVVSARSHRRWR